MKSPFAAIAKPLRRGAIAIVLTAPLLLPAQPAEANFLQKLGEILRGDTQAGAEQGSARGAAIRDRVCAVGGAGISRPQDDAANDKHQLIILVPNTLTPQKTVSATPEIFVYIPPEESIDNPPTRSLEKLGNAQTYKQIDLDNIGEEDIFNPGALEAIEQAEQGEVVLEVEIGETYTAQYSLPQEALIARIQIPEAVALSAGETDQKVSFELNCVRYSIFNLTGRPAETIREETNFVEATIQKIVDDELLSALNMTNSAPNYEVYLDNDIWLDMVAALADNPSSPEWQALLEALDIPPVNPVPQPLELFSPATE